MNLRKFSPGMSFLRRGDSGRDKVGGVYDLRPLVDQIVRDPGRVELHFELAKRYFEHGRYYPAIAECRTAAALGVSNREVRTLLARSYVAVGCAALTEDLVAAGMVTSDELGELHSAGEAYNDGLVELSPVVYQRLKRLSRHILGGSPAPNMRVLDVGGGEGHLCLFLPRSDYVLAEPTINGITGQTAAFGQKSFDVVVACHVLEHIPDSEKERFLDRLCTLAKKRVILLGPVGDDGYAESADALIYELTRAAWAAEHMDCRLPTLEELRGFAERRKIGVTVTPNGDRAAAFWMVLARHYAAMAGRQDELREAVRYSNKHLDEHISNMDQPNDYIVEFEAILS